MCLLQPPVRLLGHMIKNWGQAAGQHFQHRGDGESYSSVVQPIDSHHIWASQSDAKSADIRVIVFTCTSVDQLQSE